jgi:hypothetical protein
MTLGYLGLNIETHTYLKVGIHNKINVYGFGFYTKIFAFTPQRTFSTKSCLPLIPKAMPPALLSFKAGALHVMI